MCVLIAVVDGVTQPLTSDGSAKKLHERPKTPLPKRDSDPPSLWSGGLKYRDILLSGTTIGSPPVVWILVTGRWLC